ncbi:MAG TPA: sugar phosphate nucleotidyltransferase [Trueperaceae bacterium]|nr:sugar phosphate nucleotidyltransferase [Trueperaceae bacterium]
MSDPSFVAVIMAGGQGQRFWPLSTAKKPKQFLDLSRCGRTLLQATYDRVLPLAGSPERVMVATAVRYVDLVCEQLPELPVENLLVEPQPRDSAPAIAFASLTIEKRFGPDVVAGFFSSDHEVGNGGAFAAAARAAIELADAEGGLVTIGITPTRPATGYGYIEVGESVGRGHQVARFVEKPNLRTAEAYLASGGYLWNAGIFVWRVGAALAELDRHDPELMQPLRAAFEGGTVAESFASLKKISIDFALMERTDRALVVPGDFGWDDIGDWVALERLLGPSDGPGGANTVVGHHVGLDTSRNIVYTDSPDDVIVTLGVHDLVIVKRGNTVMLIHRERVQEIKSLLADERMAELLAEVDGEPTGG